MMDADLILRIFAKNQNAESQIKLIKRFHTFEISKNPWNPLIRLIRESEVGFKLRLEHQYQEGLYLRVVPNLHHHQWRCGSFFQQHQPSQLRQQSHHHR